MIVKFDFIFISFILYISAKEKLWVSFLFCFERERKNKS